MELKFYNTMYRGLQDFKPIEPGRAKMYTCGPTVYNFAHIGNFRAYLFEDLLHRVLRYFGYEVTQVMNLTDVDDKTIRDSRKEGIPLKEFTARYIKTFFEDLKTLSVTPAAVYPPATGHIPEMIALIQKLMDGGFAYQAEDKSIYFSIDKFPNYGKLAHIDRENQLAGVRIDADEYAKDSVGDFALWKARDEADGDVFWPSPWGEGRPGWHIECSAMAMKYLGKTFDIHTGGIDNMFPHHEDEIAQSECANGCRYVNCWMHCAHLMVNGEKMSKSLGNFYTLRDLLGRGWRGDEIRFVLLSTHYRKKLNFTFDALKQARETLEKFGELFARLRGLAESGASGDDAEAIKIASECAEAFKAGLGDDLNISAAMAALFNLQRGANRLADAGNLGSAGASRMLEVFTDFDRVLAFLHPAAERRAAEAPAEVVKLAEERALARKNKDFARSDELRDWIKQAGYAVEDAPGGTFKLKKL